MSNLTLLLIGAAALLGSGLIAVQVFSGSEARAAAKAEAKAAADAEAKAVAKAKAKADAEAEAKAAAEAAQREERIRDEENQRILAPGGVVEYIRHRMTNLQTNEKYVAARMAVNRAMAGFTEAESEIALVEGSLKLRTSVLMFILGAWAIVVVVNTIMNFLVIESVLGWAAWLTAPALVLVPSISMAWIRNAYDRHGEGTGTKEAFQRTMLIGIAAILVAGGIMFLNAGGRADYLYRNKIDGIEIQLTQLRDEEVPDEDQIAMQEKLLGRYREKLSTAEDFFRGAIPMFLLIELIGAFYASEYLPYRRLRRAQKQRALSISARDGSQEVMEQMEAAMRNEIINRLYPLGVLNEGLAQMTDGVVEGAVDERQIRDIFLDDVSGANHEEPGQITTDEPGEGEQTQTEPVNQLDIFVD